MREVVADDPQGIRRILGTRGRRPGRGDQGSRIQLRLHVPGELVRQPIDRRLEPAGRPLAEVALEDLQLPVVENVLRKVDDLISCFRVLLQALGERRCGLVPMRALDGLQK